MPKGLKILLTFKPSEKYIYDEVVQHSGKSGWIKDVLKVHVRPPNTTDK